MMTLLLLSAGCKNISANNLCLSLNPITITKEEFDTISEETLRQIDNFNQEVKENCQNQ